MKEKTLFELHNLLVKKKISSLDLSKYFLKRIENNNELNVFIDINYKLTLSQAKKADILISKKKNSFLTGIPIVHKDIFVTKFFQTTSGSKILKNYVSPYDATLVKRLKNLGMVVLGKTNMNEFGVGSDSINKYYGNVNNPWNKYIISGGSSGGSSTAVSSRLTPAATASDTGGSIRQPSLFNGIIGIKPTYGRVSRYGMISYSSSLDQAGILTKNVLDCSILLNGISGLDLKDCTTLSFKKEDYTRYINKTWLLNDNSKKPLYGLSIGISKDYFNDILDYNIRSNIEYVLSQFEFLGAKIIYICYNFLKFIIPIYYVISSGEICSNLSRFDGLLYGYKKNNFNNYINYTENFRGKYLNEEIKNRILIGTYILSSNKKKKYFSQSKKLRFLVIEDIQRKFNICDIIISPISPVLPWYFYKNKINFKENNFIDMYTIFTNIAGLPCMSIPSGFVNKNNIKIPIGFQIIANYCKEARMIQIAYEFEKITDWYKNISLCV